MVEFLVGIGAGVFLTLLTGFLVVLLFGRKDKVPSCKCKKEDKYKIYHGLYLDD